MTCPFWIRRAGRGRCQSKLGENPQLVEMNVVDGHQAVAGAEDVEGVLEGLPERNQLVDAGQGWMPGEDGDKVGGRNSRRRPRSSRC